MNTLFTDALILTMRDGCECFRGCVGVRGNRIALVSHGDAGADDFAASCGGDVRRVDCRGNLLMPGLINTHCHVAMTLQRGFADDIPLMRWLNDYVWKFEAVQTPDDIETGARLGVAEMLLGGVTTFVDMYWHEARVARAVRDLGARAVLTSCYLDGKMEAFRDDLSALLSETASCDRIAAGVSPHAPYTCSGENITEGFRIARENNLAFSIHVAETPDESRIMVERCGMTPVEYLESLGVLDDRTIAAHCVHLTDNDRAILLRRGVTVAHNPTSNMKISSGIAPIEQLRAEGVNCTVATDGTCSNNDLDMWEEMRMASFLQKVSTMNPCAVPAYDILRMATVNGAAAVGHAGSLGVIAEGALADMILLDLRKPHLCPVHNLVANIVYCGKASDVDTVMVDGRIVVENRRLLTADVERLMSDVEAAANRIVGEM